MADEHGSTVPAGPITFVIEHRSVRQDGVDSGGPTVRVLGAADRHEYLRFDMFDVGPHYHYEPPGATERVVTIDTVADGDAVSWSLSRLRERLRPMLTEAGGQALLEELDEHTVGGAVADVEVLVRNPPHSSPDDAG